MDDLVKRTIEAWEPRYGRPLSDADAREIVRNVTGFFDLLAEWDAKERLDAARDARMIQTPTGGFSKGSGSRERQS